jgi:CBS domain-containing protein
MCADATIPAGIHIELHQLAAGGQNRLRLPIRTAEASMRAHQIMTRPVITVLANTTIVEAANIMLRRHISGLPVVDAAGKLIGIVSEGDFIRRSEIGTQRKRNRLLKFILGAGQAATDFVHENGRRISEVMTSDPVTVTEGTPVEEIVTLMQKKSGIKRLGEKFIGIVAPICCTQSQPLPGRFPTPQPMTITFVTASSLRSARMTGVPMA